MAVKALINAAIDSSRKARMQRAKDQGFGEDTYRGIYGDYDPSKQGYYQMFTSSPQDAGEYGDNVIKAKLRKGNNLEIDGRGKNFNDIYIGGLPSNVFDKLHSSVKESLTARTDDIAHAAKAAGYDSVTIKDIYDKVGNEIPLKPITKSNKNDVDMLSELGIDPNDPILNTGSTSVSKNVDIPRDYNTTNIDIVFDPSNIRSVNAQFDPAKRTSANLLASAAGAGVLGAAALTPQEAEAGPISKVVKEAAIAAYKETSPKALENIYKKRGKNNVDLVYQDVRSKQIARSRATTQTPKKAVYFDPIKARSELESAGYRFSGSSEGSQYYLHPDSGTKVRISDHEPVHARSTESDIWIHPGSIKQNEMTEAIQKGAKTKPTEKIGRTGIWAQSVGAGAGVLGTAALTPQDAEAGPVNIIDPITGLIRKGIEAYHGTPHRFPAERMVRYADGRTENLVGAVDRLPDVPAGAEVIQDYPLGRMRMDKIGTGEGAQAYGYGLYSADSQDVAKGYREGLTDQNPSRINRDNAAYDAMLTGGMDESPGTAVISTALSDSNGDIGKALADVRKRVEKETERNRLVNAYVDGVAVPDINTALAKANDLVQQGNLMPVYKLPEIDKGSLYRTELDVDPDTLLDWDKPLSEQSESVRNALKSRMDGPDNYLTDTGSISNPTGKQIYEGFGFDTDVFSGKNADVASKELHQFGIPGIRYLDGSSRNAGEGSSNYVIFDDSKINIKERGMATPAALAVTAGVTGTGMALSDSPDYLDSLASQVNRGPEGSLYDAPQEFAAQQPYETPTEVAPQYQPPAIHSASALGEAFGATSRFIANKNPYVTALASQIDVGKEWDKPMARMYGLGAALKVLANGGTFENALLRGSKVGGQSIDEIGQELGEYVADKTGNPYAAAISKAIVTVASP